MLIVPPSIVLIYSPPLIYYGIPHYYCRVQSMNTKIPNSKKIYIILRERLSYPLPTPPSPILFPDEGSIIGTLSLISALSSPSILSSCLLSIEDKRVMMVSN